MGEIKKLFYMRYQGRSPFYEVNIVGLAEQVSLSGGLYTIRSDRRLEDLATTE